MQSQIDTIHILPPQGGVHDHWGERMRYRIPGHAINPGGGIDLLDPVGVSQFRSRDLAGRRPLSFAGGSKGKHTAGAYAEQARDDSLLSHAKSDERVSVAALLEELHHGYVVIEDGGGGHDLVVVGWIGGHLLERLFELLSGA